jgi:hypothetical protein
MSEEELLLGELRQTNAILKLAFSKQIAQALEVFTSRKSFSTVMAVLADGEQPTKDLMDRVARHGVARSTAFEVIATLERAGIVGRPRRGVLALSEVAIPYVTPLRETKNGGVEATHSENT